MILIFKLTKGTWIVRIEFYFQNESSHDSPSMEILPLRKSKSPIVIEGRFVLIYYHDINLLF